MVGVAQQHMAEIEAALQELREAQAANDKDRVGKALKVRVCGGVGGQKVEDVV